MNKLWYRRVVNHMVVFNEKEDGAAIVSIQSPGFLTVEPVLFRKDFPTKEYVVPVQYAYDFIREELKCL